MEKSVRSHYCLTRPFQHLHFANETQARVLIVLNVNTGKLFSSKFKELCIFNIHIGNGKSCT